MQWREVGTGSEFYVLEYQAKGYARTNCCAFRMGHGFVVLSPASDVTESHLRFLEEKGPILALLLPHSGHTLGIPDWLKLRPALPVYAAPGSVERIAKICKIDVKPVGELPIKDDKVKISLAPGMNEASIFLEVRRGDRPVVYADEVLEDLDRYPGPWFVKPLMHVLGKKPGFHVNSGVIRFYVKEVEPLKKETLRLIDTGAHIVFAHGPVRSSASDVARTKALVDSI